MSLLVRLPLNGNLNNYGSADVTVTNNGATVSDNGKLGKCYAFNGSSNYLKFSKGYFGSNWSYSIWVYTTATTSTQTLGCCRTTTGSGFSLFLIGGKLRIDPGGNNVQWTTGYTYPANTWFHLTVTCDNGSIKYYINGEYKETYSTTLVSSQWGNTVSIGSSQQNGSSYGNYLNGRLNDIRIYDHCLSEKEVKELSKGLVLHYLLNRGGLGQENIIPNSKIDGSWTYPSSSYSDKYFTITTVIPSATQYTLSFDAKSTVNGDKMRTHYYSPNTTTTCVSSQGITKTAADGNMDFTLSTQWQRYWVTYTQTETTAVKHLICPRLVSGQGSGTVSVKNVKLEEGSIATPWCPNSSDVLATTMGINGTIEYDCSGFGNNGTRTGTFDWTSDTPKYQVSTKFDTTSTKIKLPAMSFTGMANSYTFSWWQYNTSTGNMPWGFSDGNRLNCYHCSPLCWDTGDGSNNQFKDGSTTIAPTTVQNGWHHMVVTGDGTATKLYIDGVYKGTATTYKPLTGTQIWISGWNSGTSYTFNGSKESDFRIYATALSADDIQTLFQSGRS